MWSIITIAGVAFAALAFVAAGLYLYILAQEFNGH